MQTKPSQIYTFTEDFKLTGQHFDLEDADGNLVYAIDSTVPLKTFRIYDAAHNEVFRMTKELLHVLPTYRFICMEEPYGTLQKKFALVKDRFSMELPEGTLELMEYAGSIGHNYRDDAEWENAGRHHGTIWISRSRMCFSTMHF